MALLRSVATCRYSCMYTGSAGLLTRGHLSTSALLQISSIQHPAFKVPLPSSAASWVHTTLCTDAFLHACLLTLVNPYDSLQYRHLPRACLLQENGPFDRLCSALLNRRDSTMAACCHAQHSPHTASIPLHIILPHMLHLWGRPQVCLCGGVGEVREGKAVGPDSIPLHAAGHTLSADRH